MTITYGLITNSVIEHTMKYAMHEAITKIQACRSKFYVQTKTNSDGSTEFFTSADTAAQNTYLSILKSCFPTFGIIAEEENISIPCTNKQDDIYWTIDALDGTNAHIDRMSEGIGTMISFVCNNEVKAAYVGDALTGEIYGFGPSSNSVYKIDNSGYTQLLPNSTKRPLYEGKTLLRRPVACHSRKLQQLLTPINKGGLCDQQIILGGSIGTWMAKLWTNEVTCAFLGTSCKPPWDTTPIFSISKMLGYEFFKVNNRNKLVNIKITCTKNPYQAPEMIVIHKSNVPELIDRYSKLK